MDTVVYPLVVRDVGSVKAVVAIDVDVHVTAPPVASAPQGASDGDASCEPEHASCDITGRIPVIGRVIRISPCAIDHGRVVRGNVNDLRIGRFDDNDRFLLSGVGRYRLLFDLLFFGRLEITGCICLCTQILDRCEHVLLLREKRITQLLGPADLVAHHFQNLGKRGQRFDAWVPRFFLHGALKRISGHTGIGLDPPLGLNHLERVGGRHQDLRDKRIRVECDWRDQLFELFLRQNFRCFVGACNGYGQSAREQ